MTQQGTYDKCGTCAYSNAPKDNLACVGCYAGRNYKPKEYRPKVNYSDARMVGGRRRIIFNPKYYLDVIVKKVIFNPPATIVLWADGFPKTVVKCQPGDTYDREKGLAMCIAKRMTGNRSSYCDVFKKWCGDDFITELGENIRINLIVTAATRAAYMHANGCIDIPNSVEGEDYLAKWIEETVDNYFPYRQDDKPFDEYIENCLRIAFGVDKNTWPKENPHVNINPIYETRKELRDEFLIRAAGEFQHMTTTGVIAPPADCLKARKYVVDVVDEYVNNPDVHTGDFWEYINIVFKHDFGKESNVKGEN